MKVWAHFLMKKEGGCIVIIPLLLVLYDRPYKYTFNSRFLITGMCKTVRHIAV